jgi:hypothetical protein
MPRRISRRDLDQIRAMLEPEPWQQAVLDTLHRDYVDAWQAEVDPFVRLAKDAHAGVHGVDTRTMLPTADVEQLRLAYAHARDATDRMAGVDGRFFEDLAVALNEDQQSDLRRARLMRDLDRYLRGTDPFFDPSGMAFRPANVIEVVDRIELDPEERRAIDEHLDGSGADFLAAARSARDVRFESERQLHEMNIRMAAGMADGTLTSSDHGLEYRRLSDAMSRDHGELMAGWTKTHADFVDALRDRLGPEHRAEFSLAWKRASNPYVYRDGNCATVPLEQALQIPDLTSEQLDAVAEVLADYDGEWLAYSSDMASIRNRMKAFGANSTTEEYDLWRQLDAEYRSLDFSRNEASIKALRRAARYLEPEQRKRIRALRLLAE